MFTPTVMQKGGVGKSSVTVHLATTIRLILDSIDPARRIVLLDTDPQGTSTAFFGWENLNPEETVASLFDPSERFDPYKPHIIRKTRFQGIDLVPSCIDLAVAEAVDFPDGNTRIRSFLEASIHDNPIILADSPPSLGRLTLNLIEAADALIIPLMPDITAYDAIGKFFQAMRSIGYDRLKVFGYIVNNYDGRTRAQRLMKDMIVGQVGPLFMGEIHRTSEIPECWMTKRPITQTNKKFRPYREFKAIAMEYLRRYGYETGTLKD